MLLTNNMDNDKTEESAEFKESCNEYLQYTNAFELGVQWGFIREEYNRSYSYFNKTFKN